MPQGQEQERDALGRRRLQLDDQCHVPQERKSRENDQENTARSALRVRPGAQEGDAERHQDEERQDQRGRRIPHPPAGREDGGERLDEDDIPDGGNFVVGR
jgi:hypothetical protein